MLMLLRSCCCPACAEPAARDGWALLTLSRAGYCSPKVADAALKRRWKAFPQSILQLCWASSLWPKTTSSWAKWFLHAKSHQCRALCTSKSACAESGLLIFQVKSMQLQPWVLHSLHASALSIHTASAWLLSYCLCKLEPICRGTCGNRNPRLPIYPSRAAATFFHWKHQAPAQWKKQVTKRDFSAMNAPVVLCFAELCM